MSNIFIVPLENSDSTCIIDETDRDYVMRYQWRLCTQSGYIQRYIGIKYLRLHTFLTNYEIVDHINRLRYDNRRCNLREASILLNNRNKGIGKANKSGYKGVSFCSGRNKWIAQIRANRSYFLGYFDSPELAAIAYNKAAILYHKEFAYLNQIENVSQ